MSRRAGDNVRPCGVPGAYNQGKVVPHVETRLPHSKELTTSLRVPFYRARHIFLVGKFLF